MKKKIIVLIILFVLLICTGCTKYIKDEDKKIVKYEKTGQNLTANILCKPSTDNLIKEYEKHDDKLAIKMEKLPVCKNFKPSSIKYTGPWESIFVKPLAFVILKVGNLVKNYGLSVMIVGLLIRIIMLPLSIKSTKQAQNMKKAKPEIDKIEKKYKDKTDSASMMAKSQETMLIYKKNNINPLSGCLMAFVQLPLFFAFLEAINRVPAIFEGKFATLNLGMTPWVGIASGKYLYIILIALIIITTYFSFKNTMASTAPTDTKDATNQMQFMFKFMIIMISVASLSLPAAIALYWIVTNGFAIVQNIIVKRMV